MKTINGIFQKSVKTVILSTAIFCATEMQAQIADNNLSRVNNTGKEINLVHDITHTAKAHALNASINGPFTELKPALAPQGNRLYFSRSEHPLNTGGESDLEDIVSTPY